MIRKVLGGILLYAVFVYALVVFGPGFDFHPITLNPSQGIDNVPFFLVFGGLLRLIYDVIRHILKLVTVPVNMIGFGTIHILLNVGVLYLLPYAVNKAGMGTTVIMGSFFEVAIMALMLGFIGLLFKYV